MDETVYHQFWNDRQATVLAVYLKPQEDPGEVRRRIEEVLVARKPIVTISQTELRTDILAIFDRTFRVTYVLEFIALSVALLGIVNTLVTAILERPTGNCHVTGYRSKREANSTNGIMGIRIPGVLRGASWSSGRICPFRSPGQSHQSTIVWLDDSMDDSSHDYS